jgi:hypothetical protein
MIGVLAVIAGLLFLGSCSTTHQSEVPFETLWHASPTEKYLSDNDEADILQLARVVSDTPIQKVTVHRDRTVVVVVAYESELVDTYNIETKLEIYEKTTRQWKQNFIDSLTISRGKWGTKPDSLRREVLRVFNIDETKINLRVPDGMSYQEMRQLLKAIKDKEIVWEDQRPLIKDFAIQDITRIILEGPEPLYVISIVKQHSPPVYFVFARLEGTKLVVKRTDGAIP